MADEKEVIEALVQLVEDAANPREARIAINQQFPDWDDREKLKKLLPRVERRFSALRQNALRKTSYFKIFLIGPDDIRARGKRLSELNKACKE